MMIREGMRVLEVSYQKRYTDGAGFENKKYYYWTDNKDIKKGDVIGIEPNNYKTPEDKLKFNLFFVIVRDIIVPEIINRVELVIDEHSDFRISQAKYAPKVIQFDLHEYIDEKNRDKELAEIKAVLNNACTEINDLIRFEQLAKLNPKYKETYDRFLELISTKSNTNTLTDNSKLIEENK